MGRDPEGYRIQDHARLDTLVGWAVKKRLPCTTLRETKAISQFHGLLPSLSNLSIDAW